MMTKEIKQKKNKHLIISKDPTTISYEVKHHRQEHRNSYTNQMDPCPFLLKAPFVCNGCQKRHSSACHFIHFLYRAAPAQLEYKLTLSSSGEGIPLNKEKFYCALIAIRRNVQYPYKCVLCIASRLCEAQKTLYFDGIASSSAEGGAAEGGAQRRLALRTTRSAPARAYPANPQHLTGDK